MKLAAIAINTYQDCVKLIKLAEATRNEKIHICNNDLLCLFVIMLASTFDSFFQKRSANIVVLSQKKQYEI